MLDIGIKSDMAKLARAFDRFQESQVKFATSLAINWTADIAKLHLRGAMAQVFHKPKPYTLNSLYVKNSTKSNLTALVGFKDGSPTAKAMRAEVIGGARRSKGFENVLSRQNGGGRIAALPAKGLRLDTYGNIPTSVIDKAMAAVKGGKDRRGVFVVPMGSRSHLPPGVYQRQQKKTRTTFSARRATSGNARGARVVGGQQGVKLLLAFEDQAQYRPKLDMLGIVSRTVQSEFGRQFAEAMDHALSTGTLKL
jgi:hypothetical protein